MTLILTGSNGFHYAAEILEGLMFTISLHVGQ